MRVSNMSYTVHANEGSNFLVQLQNFLLTLKLLVSDFNTLTNTYSYKINLSDYMKRNFENSDVLSNLQAEITKVGKTILSVQVLENNKYKIRYFDIAKYIELEDSKKTNKNGEYSDCMRFYRKILSNDVVLQHEINSFKTISEFITVQAFTTTINSIDIASKFLDEKLGGMPLKKARTIFKTRTLSQLIEKDGSHLTYKMKRADVDTNVYSIPFTQYIATITDPQKIVDLYHTKKSLPLQSISDMDENKILKILSAIIVAKLKSNKKLVKVKADSLNGYHVVAEASCRNSWVAQINIIDGVTLIFEPLFKSDTNYASLSTVKEKYDLKFYKCEGSITSTVYKKMKDKSSVHISPGSTMNNAQGKVIKKFPTTYTKAYDKDILNTKAQYFATIHINNFTKDDGTIYSLSELDEVASHISRVAANYVVGSYRNTSFIEYGTTRDELQDDIRNSKKIVDLGVGGYSFDNEFYIAPDDIFHKLKRVI